MFTAKRIPSIFTFFYRTETELKYTSKMIHVDENDPVGGKPFMNFHHSKIDLSKTDSIRINCQINSRQPTIHKLLHHFLHKYKNL